MATKKTKKRAPKRALLQVEIPVRQVPSTLEVDSLKLKFKKVVRGVTHASLELKSGIKCALGWDVPSRCLVHGQVEFDKDKTIITAEFQGVNILGGRIVK